MGVATHLHLRGMDTLASEMREGERTGKATGKGAEYKRKLVCAVVSTPGVPLLQSDLHMLDLPSTQHTVVSHTPQVELKPEQSLPVPHSYPFALVPPLQGYQTSSGQPLRFFA